VTTSGKRKITLNEEPEVPKKQPGRVQTSANTSESNVKLGNRKRTSRIKLKGSDDAVKLNFDRPGA